MYEILLIFVGVTAVLTSSEINPMRDGDDDLSVLPWGVPNVPPECKEKGYCLGDVPDYPQELIDSVINKLTNKDIFKSDETAPEAVQARNIMYLPYFELCNSDAYGVYPVAGKDENGVWHWIVNTKQNQVQGLKYEQCRNEGSCTIAPPASGYSTQCHQKHGYRNLVTFDKKNSSIILGTSNIYFPTCCVCAAIKNGQPFYE